MRVIAAIVLTVAMGVSGVVVIADGDPKTLSTDTAHAETVLHLEEQLYAAQVQNARLRATLADTQAQLDSLTLTAQGQALSDRRAALAKQERDELGAGPDDEVDTSTSPPRLRKRPTPPAAASAPDGK